jgi:hypothetical protein
LLGGRRSQAACSIWNHIEKKTFTYTEKSEEARIEYLEKLAKIPEETRAYIDESGINKPLLREYGRAARGKLVEDAKRGGKFQR